MPSPGGAKELGELAGMLASTQLDRRRPLWELWFIEGCRRREDRHVPQVPPLPDGRHGRGEPRHRRCSTSSPTPPSRCCPLPSRGGATAGPEPSNLPLLAESLQAGHPPPVAIARYVTGMAAEGRRELRQHAHRRGEPGDPPVAADAVQRTDRPSPRARVRSIALADVRALKDAHGVKVNDVVLAVVARRAAPLLRRPRRAARAPLVTAVPVSTRAEGDTAQNNQITNMFVSLATDVEDPIERLQAIYKSTASAKTMTKAIGARQIQSLGEVAVAADPQHRDRAALPVAADVAGRHAGNTLVSNVPGPPIPLYMCGAKVTAIYPSSVILEGMGLNTTVISYEDRLDFGFHVDPDLVPDPWLVADGVTESLAELMEASGLGAPTPVDDPFTAPAPAAASASTVPAEPARPHSRLTARVRRDVFADRAAYRFATSQVAAPTPEFLARVADEVREAAALFDERGWIADPESYHSTPVPLQGARHSRIRATGLPATRLTWPDRDEPRPEEPGADRYVGYGPNRIARAGRCSSTTTATGPGSCACTASAWARRLWICGPSAPGTCSRASASNVAFLTQPFHGKRNPGSGRMPEVPGLDVLDTVHALTQAVWDTRQLIAHLRTRTDQPVGLMGLSLGGLVTAITASVDEPHAALALVPAVDLPPLKARAAEGVDDWPPDPSY